MASANPDERPSSPSSARRLAQNARKRLGRLIGNRGTSADRSSSPSNGGSSSVGRLTLADFSPPGIAFHAELVCSVPVDRSLSQDDLVKLSFEQYKARTGRKFMPVRIIMLQHEVVVMDAASHKIMIKVASSKIAKVVGPIRLLNTMFAFTSSAVIRREEPPIRKLNIFKLTEAAKAYDTLQRLFALHLPGGASAPSLAAPRPRSLLLTQQQGTGTAPLLRSGSEPLPPVPLGNARPPLPAVPGRPARFTLGGATLGVSADYASSGDEDVEIASMHSEDEIRSMNSDDERAPVAGSVRPSIDLSKFEFDPAEAWTCPNCQHHNTAAAVDQCAHCGALRPEALGIVQDDSARRASQALSGDGQYVVNDQLYSSVVPSRRVSMMTVASSEPEESRMTSQQGSSANLVSPGSNFLPPPLPPRSKSQLSMDPLVEGADESSARSSVDIAQDAEAAVNSGAEAVLATAQGLVRMASAGTSSDTHEPRSPSTLRNAQRVGSASPDKVRKPPAEPAPRRRRTVDFSAPGQMESPLSDVQQPQRPATASGTRPSARTKGKPGVKLHATNPFAMFESDV
eukprot:TRINITY_DN8992_c0_g2_i2.p1 TRINITY_DN8992_c0_g2~~TRINITY_DN8992_c0_g2_i2.p1  ORF type:complete len:570 (+),score=98.08 TRINITY_DN8992_c0_g2_i2:160-1869(+)